MKSEKFFNFFVVTMVVMEATFLGMNLADNHRQDAISSGVLLAFWVIFLLWLSFNNIRKANISDRLANIMDNAMHDVTHFIKQEERNRTNAKAAEAKRGSGKTTQKRATARSGSQVKNSKVRSGSKGTSSKTRS